MYQTIAFPGTAVWDYAIKNKIIDKDFYEKKQKEFVDVDIDVLLTKEVSKEDFLAYFNKFKSLNTKGARQNIFKNILKIKPRHIKSMLSVEFFKKVNNLKGQFLKRFD